MQFLCIHRAVEKECLAPDPDEFVRMGALIDEMQRAGVLVSTGGCMPSVHGARVRNDGGAMSVTDGPFSESKEVVGGFAILEVPTKEDAVAWTRRFLSVIGDGETEIRALFQAPNQ